MKAHRECAKSQVSSRLKFHCQRAISYLTNKVLLGFFLPTDLLFTCCSTHVIVSARFCFEFVVFSTSVFLFSLYFNPSTPDVLVNLQPHPEDVYFIFGRLDHC